MANKGTVERIDTKEFDSAITAMNSAVNIFSSAREKVINYTNPVVESWEGRGASAFNTVYKKLRTELKDEEENLTIIRDDLKMIKESYEGWDQELANTFKGNK